MFITVLYLSVLNGCLNIILFFIVSFNIQAFWGTYATVPFIFIFLFEVLLRTSKLFKIAFNRQVLPAPIGPTMPIKSPFSIVNFTSFNNSIISISGIFSSDFLGSLTSNVIISLSLFSFFSSLSFLFSLFDNNFLIFSLLSSSWVKSKSCNSISFSSFSSNVSSLSSSLFLFLLSLIISSFISLLLLFNSSSSPTPFSNSSLFLIIPKSNPSISIAIFSSLFGFIFLINSVGLYSFLFKKTSILFNESKESFNPLIYSGRRKSGSAKEWKMNNPVKTLLKFISSFK